MNCPKCNTSLRPGVKFCTSCGQKNRGDQPRVPNAEPR